MKKLLLLAGVLLASSSTNASPVISVSTPDALYKGDVSILAPKIVAADTPDLGNYSYKVGDAVKEIPHSGIVNFVPFGLDYKRLQTFGSTPMTKNGFVFGTEAFYHKGGRIRDFTAIQGSAVYRHYNADTDTWVEAKQIRCFNGEHVCSADAAQNVTLANGDILQPVTFLKKGSKFFSVSVLRLKPTGDTLRVLSRSVPVTYHQGRGFLEPQLAVLNGKYTLSIRAENGFAYHSQSKDGQHFTPVEKWRFGNGEYLATSSTQQHFMTYKGHLWFLYVRKTGDDKVVRYRGRLYMAMINSKTNRLVRSTETIVFDRTSIDPATTLHFGNFFVNGNSVYCYAINIVDWTGKNYKAEIK